MPSTARRAPEKIAFNKTVVAALEVPPTGRIYYHDSRVPGLTVCVTHTGSRTYYLYRWANGRPLRQRLGTTDEMSVENARDANSSASLAIFLIAPALTNPSRLQAPASCNDLRHVSTSSFPVRLLNS